MPAKKSKGTSTMLGGTGGDLNPRAVIKDIIAEVGGRQAFSKHVAKYLNDEKANPYLQSRSMQNIMRLLTISGGWDEDEGETLSEDELETAVMKDAIRFFVTMPDDVYNLLFERIQERRAALARCKAASAESLAQQQRPLGSPR